MPCFPLHCPCLFNAIASGEERSVKTTLIVIEKGRTIIVNRIILDNHTRFENHASAMKKMLFSWTMDALLF
jgi:hypothetical protein